MTTSKAFIKGVLFSGACALVLSATSGVATANSCMKKSYGYGHMKPMYPRGMQSYYGTMQPYGYPAYTRKAPANQGLALKEPESSRQQRESRPSSIDSGPPASEPDIIETAAVEDFDILIKAVVAADLYDTLRGDGPFTVFAPTDEAFSKLPDGMLDELLADKDMLAAVLSYHVLQGRLTAADLLKQREFKTVQGQTLTIDDLEVVSADIDTANGIIHVIDSVLMPNL